MQKTQSRNSSPKKSSPTSLRKKFIVTSEEWFRTTLYSIGDAVITTDNKGKVLHMNPVAERLTGWKEAEAQGQILSKVFRIINEQTRKKVTSPVQRILREGIIIGLANHTLLISRNGKEYPIADAGAPIKDKHGKIVGVVLVFRDQTQERNAQRAVEDAKNFAESIVATIREPLLVLDDKLEVVLANRSFYKLFHVTEQETIGKKVYHLGNGQWNIPKLRSLLEDILPSNSHFDNFEVHHQFEKIGERTMLLNARRLLRHQNHSQLILLAIEDITERVRSLHALQRSEQRYHTLFENMNAGFVLFEVIQDNKGMPIDLIILAGNKVFEETTGLKVADVIGKRLTQALPGIEKDEARWIETYGTIALTGNAKNFNQKSELLQRYYSISAYQAEPNQCAVTFVDITEQHLAQKTILTANQEYEKLVNLVDGIVWKADATTIQFLFVSKQAERILGYPVEQWLSQPSFWKDHIHPDDREWAVSYCIRATKEKRPHQLEYRMIAADGNPVWVRDNVVVTVRNGQPEYLYGIMVDITQHKEAELQLHQSEERFRLLAESSLTGIYLIQDQKFIYINNALASIFGYTVDEIINTLGPLDLTYPDDRPQVLKNIQQRVSGEIEGLRYEFRGLRKDGAIIYVEVHGKRIHYNGRVGIIGTLVDITARKQTEHALQESEERHRRISTLMSDYAYAFHVKENNDLVHEWITDSFTRITGFTPQEVDSRGGWSSLIHPDDVPIVVERAKRLFAGKPDTSEFRIVRKDGESRWLRDHRYPVWDQTLNRVVRIYGAAQDITEQKQSELSLKANEARYRTVVESLTQAYYEADEKGRFTYYNPGLVLISEYSEEELNRMVAFHLVSNEHRQHVVESYKRWLTEKQTNISMEFKVQTKAGKTFWVEQATHFEFDAHGTFVKAINILRDIDERKKAEEELRRSWEQYERFFMEDLSGDFISTPDGRLVACNPAYVNIFGFRSMEEALATNIASLYRTPKEQEKNTSLLLQQRKLEYYELQMVKRDGTPLYIIANIIGKFDDKGKLVEIQGYLFDDTERHQLEESLRQAQKLESIGTLASGIAHDFNNILGIILGHTSLLERIHQEPEKFSHSLQAITTATKRGASLVKQLLTFARKTESVLEPLDVNILIKELSKLLYETFPRTITIVPQLDTTIPSIIADATQIHQVLLNLCVNARDAMPKGGTLTLATSCISSEHLIKQFPQATAPQYVEVVVSDTGTGMDKQMLSRIFEPFFTTKGVGRGTGLGLSVVHGVLGAHNGFVDVESQLGRGTTFRLYLPAAEKPLFTEEITTVSPSELPGGTETILIVEDEEYLRQALENYLTTSGYTVLAAHDGLEALAIYRTRMNDIHLTISDIGLPRMSGDELFRKIKEINPKALVILASGFIEPQVKSELLKAGVSDTISKPYTLKDVLLKTRRVLGPTS